MKSGFFSGMFWGLDTFILGLCFLFAPFNSSCDAILCAAYAHDVIAALLLFMLLIQRKKIRALPQILMTPSARLIAAAAVLGGPLGMSGYLLAINNIGAAHTAIISAFYPACSTFFAVLILKESFSFKRGLALIVALIGVCVVGVSAASAEVEGSTIIGVGGALLCVFGWGSEAVFLAWGFRNSEELDPAYALFIREFTSACVYTVVVFAFAQAGTFTLQMISAPATLIVLVAAVFGVCSYLCYYHAIDTIGAARACALNISYCAWALIFSSIAAQVFPSIKEILCCVAIFVGTILSATSDWHALFQLPQNNADKME